jgi:O-glycosyl hydrolase
MGGNRIDEAHEEQWVRMISSMVAYGRTVRNLDFTLLGPMNETDWNGVEGPKVEPAQYVRLLHRLLEELDRLGLADMRLVGPDTASPARATTDYLEALAADPVVMARMAHLGIHSYDGGSAGAGTALKKSRYPALDYWVTEFAAPCPGCDTGSPAPSDWSLAAATATHAIGLLEEGAAGLLQYDAWDGYYEHHESMGYWGLLAYDASSGSYAPRKNYFVLRQLIRYVPRGAVRLPASSSDEHVSVVAFEDPASGRITIFGQNTSDNPTETTLQVPGLRGTLQLSQFVTDPERDMEGGAGSSLVGGKTTLSTGAHSIFTLTGIPTKG